MKEYLIVQGALLAAFILGSIFGAGLYHKALGMASKAVSEAKQYIADAKAEAQKIVADAESYVLRKGVPHS